MTNKKSTKHALLLSALSLLMCVSMLIGSTFAWFTDSVTSNRNMIQSGNLDVELYYTYDAEVAKNPDSDAWEQVTAATDVFGYDLWEPGYTKVAYFKVVNKGSLALKYQLSADVFDEKNGVNQAGREFLLSDYIKTALVEPDAGRDDILALTGTPLKNSFDMSKNTLEADKTAVVGLAIWMPTTVDNEANHDGNTIPEISFRINLLATQKDVESDSFGKDYDEGAIYTDAVVTSEEELKEALAAARDGAVIGIRGNVTWTTGANIGSTPFIEDASAYSLNTTNPVKHITLVGMDETATFTATGKGVGAIGINKGTVTFQNLKIVDESVSYAEGNWEYGYLEFRGNTVFENCEIVNAIMMEGDSATFKNCSFNSNKDNEYAVWVSNGNASFEKCTFTGARGLKTHEDYGSEVGTIVVNNSKFIELSKKPGLAIGDVNTDTTITLTNNEFVGTQAGDQGLYIYETDTDVTTFNFTEENNTVITGDSALPNGLYKISDNEYYVTNSNGLAQGLKTLDAGNTLIAYNDIDFGTAQLNAEKAITIDLNGNNFSTENNRPVRLTNGASIKNGTINVTTSIAAVVVHGNEKIGTIENLTINVTTPAGKTTTGIQLFNNKHVDVIKDVTITGVTQGIEVANGSSVGLIENVTVKAAKTGLQVQQSTIGEIKNSSFYGAENGVWAQLKGTNDLVLKFTNCSVSGGNYGLYMCDEGATIVPDGSAYLTYDETTTFTGSIEAQKFAFGQIGKLIVNGTKVGAYISNADELFAFAKKVNEEGKSFKDMTVYLTNDIDLNNAVWTPIGQTGATEFKGIFDGQNHTISNLNIDSSAQTGGHYSSGLFGWIESSNNITIKNVKVDGATVVGHHNVAVIAGYVEGNATIENCHVSNATLTNTHANGDACGDKTGLIAGYVSPQPRIKNCYGSDSTITSGRDAGQLIGAAYSQAVSNCSATNVTVAATGDCSKEANLNNAVIGRVLS